MLTGGIAMVCCTSAASSSTLGCADVSGVQLNSHGVEPVSRKGSGVTPCEPDVSETIVLGFALDLI